MLHSKGTDLVGRLQRNLANTSPIRIFTGNRIHASALTRPGFCPRFAVFAHQTGDAGPDWEIPAALQATFDVGNATQQLLNEQWLREEMFGNWICYHCETLALACMRPQACASCGKSRFKYIEIELVTEHMVAHVDALINLEGDTLTVTEHKIMTPHQFKDLKMPLSEHRRRSALYLRMFKQVAAVMEKWTCAAKAIVLYTSRGHGAGSGRSGAILPWKQFFVDDTDDIVQPILDDAEAVHLGITTGRLPARVCTSINDQRAEGCPHRQRCFSTR